MNSDLKVNYNSISKEYNKRYEFNELAGIHNSLEKIITENNYEVILEIGCGTGHWLNKIQNKKRKVFGCDLSTGMLKEAAKVRNNKSLFCAKANILPLQNKKFDLIFCVNALHHFENKKSFIFDAAGLLAQNGSLCVYGIDPRFSGDEWYIYDFFEDRYEKDLIRFPSFGEIQKYFSEAGLKNIQFEPVEIICNQRTSENVFDDPFLQKSGSSQLASLSDKDYEKGIEKIKTEVQNNPTKIFTSKFTFSLISGKNILK